MLSLANIYTLYFRLYFRLCICLNKLSINQSTKFLDGMPGPHRNKTPITITIIK